MNIKNIAVLLSLFVAAAVFAQSTDPVILSYQRNFVRASISTKLQLLDDASRIASVNMVPLYEDALSFVVGSYPYLGNDDQLMDIAVSAAEKCAEAKDSSAIPSIQAAFGKLGDSRARIASLNALAVLAYKRPADMAPVSDWFAKNLAAPGADVKTLAACAVVLGKSGDSSSFPILFGAYTGNYDASIVAAARDGLNSLDEGYSENILAILDKKNVKDMYAAFSLAMKKESLAKADRGRIAERAFTIASESAYPDESPEAETASRIVRNSMIELTALSWSQASPAVVKYFYALQQGQGKAAAPAEAIIPAVKCLGAMGTTDAAQTLSIYLGLLNSETEQKKNYDEQLLLVVIQALGDLGDKSAFDYLLYVGYLDYPESVKKASRDALARLAW